MSLVALVGFGFVVTGAGSCLCLAIRRKIARATLRQKHLARLLLVSGVAFSDRNFDLYAATLREIESIMRHERWNPGDIKRRMQRALAFAQATSSPELFEKACRLADNIVRTMAVSRRASAATPNGVMRTN